MFYITSCTEVVLSSTAAMVKEFNEMKQQKLTGPCIAVYISDIIRDKQEQLVSFVDSTGVVRSAHFRKDGSLRFTDDQRVQTLEDTRRVKGVKWASVQKQK